MINPDEMPPVGRRRFLQGIAAIGGLAAAGGILAACGSDSKTRSTTGASATTAGAATTAAGGARPRRPARPPRPADHGDDAPPDRGRGPGSGIIGVTLNGLNDYAKQLATGVYEAFKGTELHDRGRLRRLRRRQGADQRRVAAQQGRRRLVVAAGHRRVGGVGGAGRVGQERPVRQRAVAGASPTPTSTSRPSPPSTRSKGGTLIGEYLKEKLPTGGKICVVQGIVGQGFSELIDQGLDAAIAGTDFEVVAREQGFFDRTKAVAVVETAFQANPDLDGHRGLRRVDVRRHRPVAEGQRQGRRRPRVVRRRRGDDRLAEDPVPQGHPLLLGGADRPDRRPGRAQGAARAARRSSRSTSTR